MYCATFQGLLQMSSKAINSFSSIFGCEKLVWHLYDIDINTFSMTWRTGLRRPSNTTHSDLLHLLSDDLPIFDE